MNVLLEIEGMHLTRRSAGSAYRLEVAGLSLEQGDCLALLGPSGSGKSTLMDIMALALRPDGARRFALRTDSGMQDIQAEWAQGGGRLDGVRAGHIGYVLQTGALLPFLTVRANIELPARIGGKPASSRATELAERLGVADQLRKLPGALSVGQRQRVAIARALVHRPGLVLADEPTSSLDPLMAETVLDLLIGQVATEGATLVIATHDHAAIRRVRMPTIDLVMQPADGSGLAVARAVRGGP